MVFVKDALGGYCLETRGPGEEDEINPRIPPTPNGQVAPQ
jgi:hypothetical protein